MILIFVEQISPRLQYTLDFVFKERGYEYFLETDPESIKQSNVAILNYSNQKFEFGLHIIPSRVLFDETLQQYIVTKSTFKDIGCLAFNEISDVLSSIFYVLTRMEEYFDCERDIHDRFSGSHSVLYSNGWLEFAMCDRWAESIIQSLLENGHVTPEKQLNVPVDIHPTFDIDNAFAYQNKGFLRSVFSTFRDVKNWDTKRLRERFNVLTGKIKDPYDTFNVIRSISERGFKVHVFWLLGDYATFDKNCSHKKMNHQEKIKDMNKYVTLGIHPSYRSNANSSQVMIEKERLEKSISRKVKHSRQHFLKLIFPQTYHDLLHAGITNDYTMGYADHVGFRSGTARSFQWFDLSANQITTLTIHPFVYMDGTLNEYLNLDLAASKHKIANLYNEVRTYGGCFRFIWHNETIGDYGRWKGWSEILEYSLNLK
jgi:hypothetical protein